VLFSDPPSDDSQTLRVLTGTDDEDRGLASSAGVSVSTTPASISPRRAAASLTTTVVEAMVGPFLAQTWMGHASIATTNLYLHHLGTSADRAGLDRLNAREHKGGTNQPGAEESQA